jgi:hypothetical protein
MLSTRTYIIKKKEGYKIPSTGLLKSWSWKDSDIVPVLVIGSFSTKNIPYNHSQNKIDMSDIREYIREIVPMTIEENKMVQLEHFLYGCQLNAFEWFKNVDSKVFFNTVFNQGLDIRLSFGPDGLDEVEIQEEYYDRKK